MSIGSWSLGDRNGPAVWDAILYAVGHHWSPIIAGGCIRDFYLGVSPKDIDVFVPAEFVEDVTSIVGEVERSTGAGHLIWANREAYEDHPDNEPVDYHDCPDDVAYSGDGFAPDLIAVWEGEIIGWPVNIIGRRSLEDGPSFLLKTFDYNCVKAYHGCHGHTVTTNEFLRDIEQKTATLAHRMSYSQSLRRYHKFNSRNPGVLRLVDKGGSNAQGD